MLEGGQSLQSFVFVGNLTTKQTMAVMVETGSEETKDQAAENIRLAAMALDADFTFAIMEAWSLPPEKMSQMNAIFDKYGSIGASPFAVDTCSFMLETRHGSWMAQPVIKKMGVSKKKRTFGKVEFRFYTELQGRFAHFLPIKDDEVPGVLH
ncbi:hypothetical protein [Propionivibrio sp.]|uniref:hypothetical protein n=1 Tax=Propionivibrio sp. TaxID=2212460 RepID=UPI003BF57E30